MSLCVRPLKRRSPAGAPEPLGNPHVVSHCGRNTGGFALGAAARVMVLALCVSASTGCTFFTGSEPTPPPEAPLPTVLRLERCTQHVGFVAIPMESARARVPDGFTPVPFGAGGAAQLMAIATDCAVIDDGESARPSYQEMAFAVRVEPPADAALAGAAYHGVLTSLATPSTFALETYAEWDVGSAWLGHVALERDSPGIPGERGIARVRDAELTTVVGRNATLQDAGAMRLFQTATHAVDHAWTARASHRGPAAFTDESAVSGFRVESASGDGWHHGGETYTLTLSLWQR